MVSGPLSPAAVDAWKDAAEATPAHRRVLHVEYAADPLPGGLEWYDGCG